MWKNFVLINCAITSNMTIPLRGYSLYVDLPCKPQENESSKVPVIALQMLSVNIIVIFTSPSLTKFLFRFILLFLFCQISFKRRHQQVAPAVIGRT